MTETEVLGFNPQELFNNSNETNSQNQGNSLIYRTRPADSISEDGHYRAKIKIVYNPENPKNSILEQQSYGLQDAQGFFTVISSLTIDDKTCPIFTSWKKCHFSPEDSILYKQALTKDKGGKGLFDKRFGRYVIVQILKDKNQPDLVGSFKLWKLPTSIYTLLQQKMNPSKESGKMSIPVMDYLFGRAFNIDVAPGPDDKANPQRKTREITYTAEISNDVVSCINPDGSPLLNDSEQAILDAYVNKIKVAWDMEAEDDDERAQRDALVAEVNSSDEYKALLPIYGRVLAQIKEWAPKLESLSYKPWSDDVKKRVENWIKIVESGNDPATVSGAPAVANIVTTQQTVTSAPVSTSTEQTASTLEVDETSDLPF